MTLTLLRARSCDPCSRWWHFLCHARRGALAPDVCGCDCRDSDGYITEAALLESARRAPEHLARHLRIQQAADLVAEMAHPESVDSLPPRPAVRVIASEGARRHG